MSAQIINLAEVRARRVNAASEANAAVLFDGDATFEKSGKAPQFHFWTGASGQRYIHTIHSLLTCPELPASNYILVRSNGKSSSREVLAIGRVGHPTPSMNLAEIRQRGAELGATEVHIHLLATSDEHSRQVARDLRTAQFGLAYQA